MSRKSNLVMTYASGDSLFNQESFWVYVNSLSNINDADFVFLTHDMHPDIRQILNSKGFQIHDVVAEDVHFLYRDRHLAFWNYLKRSQDYQYVLVTDCRDVVFQRDPFRFISLRWSTYQRLDEFVLLTAEGFNMSQSGFACIEDFEFQRDVPRPYLKDNKNFPVINGGVALGTPVALRYFHFMVWSLTLKTIGRCTDQATINWMMRYLENDFSFRVSHPVYENFCLTGEGVKEGAVEPILKDRKLFSPCDDIFPYYIVHQWDRLENFKDDILTQYGRKKI